MVASNLFGDILSDLGPACTGTIGIAPSGNINPERKFPSLFEPVHGSAPDIAGQGIANPIGQIWSGAMMLEHLGEREAAAAIVEAIARVLSERTLRTRDLGGNADTRRAARRSPTRSVDCRRVMAGLDPAIHMMMKHTIAWMPGTRPGMTRAVQLTNDILYDLRDGIAYVTLNSAAGAQRADIRDVRGICSTSPRVPPPMRTSLRSSSAAPATKLSRRAPILPNSAPSRFRRCARL